MDDIGIELIEIRYLENVRNLFKCILFYFISLFFLFLAPNSAQVEKVVNKKGLKYSFMKTSAPDLREV